MKKFLVLFLFAVTAHAQTCPSRPVKLVVPFPAGSTTDRIARVIGQQLQENLGQPFVVENKPGAQGSIAASEVARAAPDGYTLMVGTNTPLAADVPAIAEELPGYELIAWFALVAPAGTPAPVIARLHEVTSSSLAKPEQLRGFIRSEVGKFARLAKEAGIQPE